MANFYEHLAPEDIVALDTLARLLLELRDSHAQLLARHGAADEAVLLELIRSGAVDEHPAYEDYLGIRSIGATRERIRGELRDYMLTMGRA